ncbi:MAG: T9SS type A sorting domain-containing protein [Rubricoccaceae bacterium]|nr:T9SS type A sorting domain-containing protein [Rubricoccaceae bacterium]
MNRSLSLLAAGLVLLGLSAAAQAQTAPLLSETRAYTLDSGTHAAPEAAPTALLVFSETVRVPGAPWLRLTFREVDLGKESYLTVTSLHDGHEQRLDTAALAQWENTSAYFNGDALEVRLYVVPGDEDVRVAMDEVIVGLHGGPETICDGNDERTSSNDPRAGRLLSIGCTAWLIEDGRFISAGHCIASAGSANVVEFNVPPSLPGGTIQHPGPEDQYTVNDPSIVFSNGGIGNDWGLFTTAPNTQTGLTALEAQGAFFDLAQDLGPPTIRITGYGVDDGADNQTQQTDNGPNAGSSGTTMRYRADTTGGNSGSPVIDDANDIAVGVHTHGGCTSSGGNNSGTSLFNAAFWQEITRDFPVAVFDPDLSEGLDVTLTPGASGTAELTISNTGEGDLNFDFTRYSEGTEGGGGPDAFGYQWVDSNEPDGPTFSFVDISATGTVVSLSDDDGEFVPLPCAFPFYGEDQTQIGISSNGYLTFDTSDLTPSDLSNDPIPSSNTPNAIIAMYWDDLDPGGALGDVLYQDMGDGRFVVQFDNVPHFPDGNGEVSTFQAILYDDGRILLQYLSMTDDASSPNGHTIGIENAAGNDGLEVVYNAPYLQDNLAILFDLVPSFITDVTPATGTVPEGQSTTVTVSLSADGFEPGTYLNFLAIQTNEPALYSYPVHLEVTGGLPDVTLDAEPTTPLDVSPGGSVAFDYDVTNNTAAPLTGSLRFEAFSGNTLFGSGHIRSGTVEGGETVMGSFVQQVPADAPPGPYDYDINAVIDGEVVASESFVINVIAAARTTGRAARSGGWQVTDATPWMPVETALMAAATGSVGGVYPNPFRGQTHIGFALEADADVRLTVYDVLGREVAVLVDGYREAGAHQAVFDARGLAAGTYVYRLTAGAEATTGRLTVLD